MTRLSKTQWQSRRDSHRARLLPFVSAHLERRKRAQKHPVWDFLFEYYSFKPSHLLRWSPGFGVELENSGPDLPDLKFWSQDESGAAFLNSQKFPLHRLESLRETLEILENTASRAPFHGCFGLHEWAMVYCAGDTRHPVPLRLSDDEIAAFVESQTVKCSHYDAFRFFTPRAISLNVLEPKFDTRANFEQPGCIHANMDLYKWAYKFAPWISSETIADAFELAKQARWLDMRAAPYDLKNFGVEPIPIETTEGRREYVARQSEIAGKAAPIRARLIAEYRAILAAIESKTRPNEEEFPVTSAPIPLRQA